MPKSRQLNFKICRSCVSTSTPNGWNKYDEEAAKEGYVYCSAEKRMVNKSFVDTCKYNVEYVVTGDSNDDA